MPVFSFIFEIGQHYPWPESQISESIIGPFSYEALLDQYKTASYSTLTMGDTVPEGGEADIFNEFGYYDVFDFLFLAFVDTNAELENALKEGERFMEDEIMNTGTLSLKEKFMNFMEGEFPYVLIHSFHRKEIEHSGPIIVDDPIEFVKSLETRVLEAFYLNSKKIPNFIKDELVKRGWDLHKLDLLKRQKSRSKFQ